jgi:6-phosphogluconate dehydrogenase
MMGSDIGIIGLAVMGANLALNIQSKGFTVSVYNRTAETVDRFIKTRAAGLNITGADTLEAFVGQLKRPRKVMLLVKAGDAVDGLLGRLAPLLEPGDILIDGGNSHYRDTVRRAAEAESRGLLYVGCGVSGGEEGALAGPSLMPGGSEQAWALIRPIFMAICAKAGGAPCCGWIGPDGAGHFVKMVHNGIEYGDMQLIGEAYHMMRGLLGMPAGRIADVFKRWDDTALSSYLIQITADILAYRNVTGAHEIDRILDTAGQKGTGKWAGIAALELGVPLTLIGDAVFARCLSAMKEERVRAAEAFGRAAPAFAGDKDAMIDDIGKAMLAAKTVSYAQGFSLLKAASEAYGWNLDCGSVALLWRGGCIIRSVFLDAIKDAYVREPGLTNLMLAHPFRERLQEALPAWRRVASAALAHGIPAPAFCGALNYFDGYTCPKLPANLLQAQRDYFGAHTYERLDAPRGRFFHTEWDLETRG